MDKKTPLIQRPCSLYENDTSSKPRPAKRAAKTLGSIILGLGISLSPPIAYPRAAEHQQAKVEHCVPHYLEGLKTPTDRVENMYEKDRVYRSLLNKYPEDPMAINISESIELERKILGTNVKLIFPNYIKQANGSVRHYHAAGIDTYTAKEFQCIVEDNVEYIKNGAEMMMKDHENMLNKILDAQEKALKKSGILKESDKLRDMLGKDVPGYEGLKVSDVLFTPDMTVQDPVPSRYYLGEIAALGVTYINTGIIGIDPKARALDYVNGKPVILIHEMTHKNPKLQSYPMLNMFDAELWASLPELVYEDMGHFMRHGYLKDIRKVAKILFNFDSGLAYKDMLSLDLMMGIEVEKDRDFEKVRGYINKVTEISKAIRKVAFEQYIPEFYTHPLYFMTLNDFLNDKNATFKLMMYMNFEPTLLGGPEKTRDFIQENEEVFDRLSREVMQDLRNERNRNMGNEEKAKIRTELEQRLTQMDPAKRGMLMNAAKRFGMRDTNNLDELIEFGLRMHRLGIIDLETEDGAYQK